jgi:hypothetical protein
MVVIAALIVIFDDAIIIRVPFFAILSCLNMRY